MSISSLKFVALFLFQVALPAISTGVFGFPMAVSCKTIMEAVKDALSDGGGVTEVLYLNSCASFLTECCLLQYSNFCWNVHS